MSVFNKVFAASALLKLNSDIKLDTLASEGVSLGLHEATDKARLINTDGTLKGIDFSKLTEECAQYIEYCMPVYCKAVLKQYSDALKLASNGALQGNALQSAQLLLDKASARMPKLSNGTVLMNLDFVTMTSAEFKSYEHADKKELGKYRDDKRGIMRMNYRRLIEAVHNLTAKKQSKPESYTELLARFHKAINATLPDGSGKHAAELSKRGINAAVLKFAFDLLENGKLLPEAAKQASKQAKATTKRAAKQAA